MATSQAAISIEIDDAHYRKIIAKLDPGEMKKRTKKAMDESLGLVQQNIRSEINRQGLRNEGHMSGSIFTEQRGAGFDSVRGVVGSPLIYTRVQEMGRRPGERAPHSMQIMDWVRRKKGLSGRELRMAAYIIARSIGKKGWTANEFMKKGADRSRRAIPRIWQRHFKITGL